MRNFSFVEEMNSLSENDSASLSILNWNGVGLGNRGAAFLFGTALQSNTSTVVLFAKYNDIRKLPNEFHWGRLQFCYLSDNPLGDDGAALIAHALVNPSGGCYLHTLHLSHCNIQDVSPLAITVQHRSCPASLRHLDLSGNPLSSKGLIQLADALQHNTSLERLSFRYVSSCANSGETDRSEVRRAFLRMLQHHNMTLQYLDGLEEDDAEIAYWLALNRNGRRYWDTMTPGRGADPTVWCAFLRHRPDLGGSTPA